MAMQTVYDAAGVAHTVEPVDAKEYIRSGSYFREPPEPQQKDPTEAKADGATIDVSVTSENVVEAVAAEAEKVEVAVKQKAK